MQQKFVDGTVRPTIDLPPAPQDRPFELLDGVRVLDLTGSIAGPWASLQLGDLGATVAKVERPGHGDDARHWGPPFQDGESLWFLSVNRNKLSVALDYSTQLGREVLGRLVAASDVVILNARRSVREKLRIDHASLREHRADLIVCSVTGFGMTGERQDHGSYDLIAEGYSGVMDLTGTSDSPPQKLGTPAADLLAGMDAAFAIVAALFDRQQSGAGHVLDISLVESMTRFLTPRLVPFLASGDLPRRTGGADSVIAIYQTFRTADDLITLGLGNDRIFRRFCEAVGRSSWADDPRYADNVKRREQRAELVTMIQEVLLEKSTAEWLAIFERSSIPAGPINTLADVAGDPMLLDRGLLFTLNQQGDPLPQVGTGWHLNGAPNGRAAPPPKLGADTETVLTEWAELDDQEISRLRDSEVI